MLAVAVVALYLAALIGVGVLKSRGVDGQASFSLAGRGLGVGVLVGTLLATWTGTGSIFGNAEQAYQAGFSALVLPLASVAGILGLAVMAPRVRRHGRYTLQDLLEDRFGPAARVIGSVTLVGAYLVIVSYQLRAGAAVLEKLGLAAGLGALDEASGKVIVALFVGTYTALAGMMSVALTDTFNGLLMTLGLALALPLVWIGVGGTDAVVAALPQDGHAVTGYGFWTLFSFLVPPFLLVLGDANLHQRFLSAKNDGAARRAALLLVPGVLLVDGIIILVAIAGRAAVPDLGEDAGHVVLELALGTLPPIVGAVLVASILAIVVSTADSFLLASTTSLVQDVYRRFLRRDADQRALLRTSRLVVGGLTVTALYLSFLSQSFFEVALFAYTIYGVGITPALLAALFWPRATPAGAVSAMLAAVGCALTWKAADLGPKVVAALDLGEDQQIEAVAPAIAVALVVLVGVSLATTPRPAPARD